jgi:hypothetical protein
MRTIDVVIKYVWSLDNSGGMSDTIKQVITNRLNQEPTKEELDYAKKQLYGEVQIGTAKNEFS